MVIIEFCAVLFCGMFFGAAFYISVVQHPASIKAGLSVAGVFFPPMYNLAAPWQIASALGGTVAGLVQWHLSSEPGWIVGAVILFLVIPFTLIFMKPINDQLLDTESQKTEPETEELLNAWAPRHWVRTILSGASFAIYVWLGVAL